MYFYHTKKINNEKVLKVAIDTAIKTFDQATFAKIKDIELQNGIIEVKVLSRLMKDAFICKRVYWSRFQGQRLKR